jgi:hypothetical protein
MFTLKIINQNEIILPIGISFFTFHSISYLVDIYKRRVEPTKNFVAYASFVSFFPQLVAGPISRAEDMLPKFLQKREIDSEKMSQGISQITLGFFKKIVVADSIGLFVDGTYARLDIMSDFQILLSAIFYSFQIYCDFSGYTDIALGLGKIFGIVLLDISIKIITAQIGMMKTNLQGTVEKIEKTVMHIEEMHERNLRLMQRQDSILSTRDTVVVERIMQYKR